MDDPIRARSTISSAIAEARASLHNPSRPFTPADRGRHLFSLPADGAAHGGGACGLGSRPGSSYVVSASQFAARPCALRLPLRGLVRQDRPERPRQPAGSACADGISGDGGGGARRAPAGADVLVLDGGEEPLGLGGDGLDADQRALWVGVERALHVLAAAAAAPRGGEAAPGLVPGPAARHEAALALERAVERACAALDGEQRLRLRPGVLDVLGPLIERCGEGGAGAGPAPAAGVGGAEEPALLMRLCNGVLRLCAPDPTGAAGSRAPSAAPSPRGGGAAGVPAAGGVVGGSGVCGPVVGACRVLFRLSKAEANDELLRTEGCIARLLDLLLATLTAHAAHAAAHAAARAQPQPQQPLPPPPSLEPLIYGLGALKNCTAACAANVGELAAQGGLELLHRLLRLQAGGAREQPAAGLGARALWGGAAEWREAAAQAEAAGQVLVQATALVRNVAASAQHRRQLVAAGLVSDLCLLLGEQAGGKDGAHDARAAAAGQGGGAKAAAAAPAATRPPRPGRTTAPAASAPPPLPALPSAASARASACSAEACLNAFRALAKLTLHEEARGAVNARPEHLPAMLAGLRAHASSEALLVRGCFALGNLTAGSAANREVIGIELSGVDFVLCLIAQRTPHSAHRSSQPSAGGCAAAAQGGSEVLVKAVRLLAHLAMAPAVGAVLAGSAECGGCLLALLEAHPIESAEELLLNAASCITNIAFHAQQPQQPPTPGSLLSDPPRLVAALLPLLLAANPEAVREATRALGNCSRHAGVRAAIVGSRAHEALLLLLGHSNGGVLLAVCGVLINLAADGQQRGALEAKGALRTLAQLLTHALHACADEAGGGECGGEGAPFALCVMAAKIVYNLSLPGGGKAKGLSAGTREPLLRALRDFERTEAAREAAGRPGGEDAQVAAERADARQVAAVLARAIGAQPPASDSEGGSSEEEGASQLEPLPLPEGHDGEDELSDGLSRLGTHRTPHSVSECHDVACG